MTLPAPRCLRLPGRDGFQPLHRHLTGGRRWFHRRHRRCIVCGWTERRDGHLVFGLVFLGGWRDVAMAPPCAPLFLQPASHRLPPLPRWAPTCVATATAPLQRLYRHSLPRVFLFNRSATCANAFGETRNELGANERRLRSSAYACVPRVLPTLTTFADAATPMCIL